MAFTRQRKPKPRNARQKKSLPAKVKRTAAAPKNMPKRLILRVGNVARICPICNSALTVTPNWDKGQATLSCPNSCLSLSPSVCKKCKQKTELDVGVNETIFFCATCDISTIVTPDMFFSPATYKNCLEEDINDTTMTDDDPSPLTSALPSPAESRDDDENDDTSNALSRRERYIAKHFPEKKCGHVQLNGKICQGMLQYNPGRYSCSSRNCKKYYACRVTGCTGSLKKSSRSCRKPCTTKGCISKKLPCEKSTCEGFKLFRLNYTYGDCSNTSCSTLPEDGRQCPIAGCAKTLRKGIHNIFHCDRGECSFLPSVPCNDKNCRGWRHKIEDSNYRSSCSIPSCSTKTKKCQVCEKTQKLGSSGKWSKCHHKNRKTENKR